MWSRERAVYSVSMFHVFQAGTITTATFSLMMTLSQTNCKDSIQGTHYSTLATCEVLGKLAFAAIAGSLLDIMGVTHTYLLFVIFAFATVPLVKSAPSHVAQD